MARIAQVTDQLVKQASRVVAGKSEQIRLIWVSLLCGGHVLLEDLPCVGKTTLAQSLGNLLGLKYQRVQFTADLLHRILLAHRYLTATDKNLNFIADLFSPSCYWPMN